MESPQPELDLHPAWQQAFQRVEGRPKDPRAHFQLGMVALELGAFWKAVDAFRRVAELAPQVEAGHFNLGNALFEASDYRGAIEAYESALRLSPEAGTWNNLGNCFSQLGLFEEAIRHYEQALRSASDLQSKGSSHHNLGHALVCRGDARSAHQHFEQACLCDRTSTRFLSSMMESCHRQKRWEEILQWLVHWPADPSHAVGKILWTAKYQMGKRQYQEALECLVHGVTEHDSSAELFQALSEIHILRGKISEGLGCMQRALGLTRDPESLQSHWIALMNQAEHVPGKKLRDLAQDWARHWTSNEQDSYSLQTKGASKLHARESGRLRVVVIADQASKEWGEFHLLPWLLYRDRGRYEVTLLWDEASDEEWFQKLLNQVDDFEMIGAWGFRAIETYLDSYGPDILLDFVGHGARNWLRVLRNKKAILQIQSRVTAPTTGLDSMDCKWIDAAIQSHVDSDWFVEPVYWMHGPMVCNPEPTSVDGIVPSTMTDETSDSIVFGYRGPCRFITPETLDFWSIVLQKVANSRLKIALEPEATPWLVQSLADSFAMREIAFERLEWIDIATISRRSFWSTIDVALDSLPVHHWSQALGAIEVGTSVFTCLSERPAGLMGKLLEHYCPHSILACDDLSKVAEMAQDLQNGISLHRRSRAKRMAVAKESPLYQPEAFAKRLEEQIEKQWASRENIA